MKRKLIFLFIFSMLVPGVSKAAGEENFKPMTKEVCFQEVKDLEIKNGQLRALRDFVLRDRLKNVPIDNKTLEDLNETITILVQNQFVQRVTCESYFGHGLFGDDGVGLDEAIRSMNFSVAAKQAEVDQMKILGELLDRKPHDVPRNSPRVDSPPAVIPFRLIPIPPQPSIYPQVPIFRI